MGTGQPVVEGEISGGGRPVKRAEEGARDTSGEVSGNILCWWSLTSSNGMNRRIIPLR